MSSRDLSLDCLAHRGATGECHLVDIGMLNKHPTGLAGTGNNIDDTWGQVRLLANFCEEKSSEGSRFSWFEHHGIPSCQGGSNLPRKHK